MSISSSPSLLIVTSCDRVSHRYRETQHLVLFTVRVQHCALDRSGRCPRNPTVPLLKRLLACPLPYWRRHCRFDCSMWQSLDGGVTWSSLGSNLTLSAIPTLQGSAVSVLSNGVLVIYSGVLTNGSAINTVIVSSTSFATPPLQYTAPFLPRYNHAYTALPDTNTTLFCAGLTTSSIATAPTTAGKPRIPSWDRSRGLSKQLAAPSRRRYPTPL